MTKFVGVGQKFVYRILSEIQYALDAGYSNDQMLQDVYYNDDLGIMASGVSRSKFMEMVRYVRKQNKR